MSIVSTHPDLMRTQANDPAVETVPLARELDELREENARLRREQDIDRAKNAVMSAQLDQLQRERETHLQRASLNPEEWKPPKWVAHDLQVHYQTVLDRIEAGHIEALRIGGRLIVNIASARRHHELLSGHGEPSR